MEEERLKGRGELILTLTIGLPVQTFRGGKEKGGGEGRGVGSARSESRGRAESEGGRRRRRRKEDTDSIASAKPDWTALSSSPSS